MHIKLSDSLSKTTKSLVCEQQNPIRMYVCGITPYDYAHVGHGRVYVTFDILYRLLEFLGYQVHYCRNFTDIDDKLINRAEKELNDPTRYNNIAQTYIDAFHGDMKALNCKAPTYEPRVTQSIDIIIDFIQKLIQNGYAYESNHDVYFHVPAFKDYAQLSKHNLADLRSGARVEISEKKRDPLDFALWKNDPESKFWHSPWGNGRPGWHIECSAMAYKHLGESINIHGGGMDLMFPHHENEIAQSEGATGKKFADIWMHVALVQINKEKMSKSLGNFFTLHDVFAQYDPMVIRFYYLTHHYRSPLDFSFQDIDGAQKAYARLCTFFNTVETPQFYTSKDVQENTLVKTFIAALENDLNTPELFGQLFSHMDYLKAHHDDAKLVKIFLQNVLGLSLRPLAEKKITITSEMQTLIDERDKARKEKNWKKADELREQLKRLGIDVKDHKL